MGFIVAIDGPSGAGKGTITSKIAEKFNLTYIMPVTSAISYISIFVLSILSIF